jgi:hypothetical protein
MNIVTNKINIQRQAWTSQQSQRTSAHQNQTRCVRQSSLENRSGRDF